MLFQLREKSGNHIGPPDKKGIRITYKAGDKVLSDDDLVAKWPNKFVLIAASENGESVSIAPTIPVPKSKGKKKDSSKKEDSKLPEVKTPKNKYSEYGVDVSKDFPTAAEAEVLVFEKSKWFMVLDPDNDEVLNEKKLRRNQIEAFIDEYLPDKDKDDEDDNTDDDEDIDDDDNEE